MKFGREFRIHLEKTLPEWRDKYLRYKLLKKQLNNMAPAAGVLPVRMPTPEFQGRFVAVLTAEIEKFNDFYVEMEEDFIIHSQVLICVICRDFIPFPKFSDEIYCSI